MGQMDGQVMRLRLLRQLDHLRCRNLEQGFPKKKQGSFRSFFGRVRVAVGSTALDSALADN